MTSKCTGHGVLALIPHLYPALQESRTYRQREAGSPGSWSLGRFLYTHKRECVCLRGRQLIPSLQVRKWAIWGPSPGLLCWEQQHQSLSEPPASALSIKPVHPIVASEMWTQQASLSIIRGGNQKNSLPPRLPCGAAQALRLPRPCPRLLQPHPAELLGRQHSRGAGVLIVPSARDQLLG